MSRHLVLTILVFLVVIVSAWAWVDAVRRPVVEDAPPPPQVPAEVRQELDALSAQVRELSKPPPPPQRPPEPPEPPPSIERIEVNGQDLADLLGLSIWKFRFRLPLDRYTGYVWVEHWTRDAERPEYRLLLTATGRWREESLVLKLPTESDRRLFISMGELHVENDPNAVPIELPTPVGSATLDETLLRPDRPVHLVTLTHNEAGMAISGLQDVHRENDQTLYIKAAFTTGDSIPFDPQKWTGPGD